MISLYWQCPRCDFRSDELHDRKGRAVIVKADGYYCSSCDARMEAAEE